jgi:hypothetical protein
MKDSKTVRVLKLVANDVAAFFPYLDVWVGILREGGGTKRPVGTDNA